MHPPRMTLDPEGHYARLGVVPSSEAHVIAAAYRRAARLVHPDILGTGDAAAFVALKQAYDVLSHPGRRSAYDRLGIREEVLQRQEHGFAHDFAPGEIDPMPVPEMTAPPTRHPRLRDLPVLVWAGMAALLMVGLIEVGLRLRSPSVPARHDPIPANARAVPPPSPRDPAPMAHGPAPVRLAGAPDFYIMPLSSPAMLWRADEKTSGLVPWGQLPPFSAVQAIRLQASSGMVEVRVTDGANGFIEAGRLTPGDAAAAARAWCTYHTGPMPAHGEMLTRRGEGRGRLAVSNRSGQPAVVKLRSVEGSVLASVFLVPGGETVMEGLPEEPVRLDFATGEVWSRACHAFAASMRARRLTETVTVGGRGRLEIPPAAGVAVMDIGDNVFARE